MRLIFAGTPEFAAVALEALRNDGHEIAKVLTQPDRPAGRGLRARPSAVKTLALERNLPILQPISLKTPDLHSELRELRAEVMIVAAYGLILPWAVLGIPAGGCLNIHASLLPRWRGAAPIQRAILAGDQATGITIMQMDEGLDTGPVLLQESMAIEDDTAGSLHDKLAALGGSCIVRALREQPKPHPQDAAAATYAAKISKHEAEIDWRADASDICLKIRAFNPVPGATTHFHGAPLKIWRAVPLPSAGGREPGTVTQTGADTIEIVAGRGSVRVSELQKAGGKRLPAGTFARSGFLTPGMRLGT